MSPISYINRTGKVHYFKRTQTKKGAYRYTVTRSTNFDDLITEIPQGFEIFEYPEDARVVLRKIVPIKVTGDEVEIVKLAMDKYSPVKDFIVVGQKNAVTIYISQFSHYFDGVYLSAEEARENWGDNTDLWKKYDWIMSFELIEEEPRTYAVIRKADVQYPYVKIDTGVKLKKLAKKYCYHVGRESLLQFWIPGEDW